MVLPARCIVRIGVIILSLEVNALTPYTTPGPSTNNAVGSSHNEASFGIREPCRHIYTSDKVKPSHTVTTVSCECANY